MIPSTLVPTALIDPVTKQPNFKLVLPFISGARYLEMLSCSPGPKSTIEDFIEWGLYGYPMQEIVTYLRGKYFQMELKITQLEIIYRELSLIRKEYARYVVPIEKLYRSFHNPAGQPLPILRIFRADPTHMVLTNQALHA